MENYYIPKLNNGQDEIIKKGKLKVTLTTSQNQNNNLNNNMTIIYLGKCETLLRNYYNISINESIYMRIIEVEQKGMKIPKIEYDVYSQLFGN